MRDLEKFINNQDFNYDKMITDAYDNCDFDAVENDRQEELYFLYIESGCNEEESFLDFCDRMQLINNNFGA
jgi:hypothetical protein